MPGFVAAPSAITIAPSVWFFNDLDFNSNEMYNGLVYGGLFISLVVVVFILWKLIIFLSSQNTKTTPTTTVSVDKGGDPNQHNCKHPILFRRQLFEGDFKLYKDVNCRNGFAICPTKTERGSLCHCCRAPLCPNPGCSCKNGNI